MTRGTASQTIKNIETLGYLTRIRPEDDRHRVQFVLTEKTRNVLANDPLGTCGRKNKLYFSFRERGKVIRIGFLLNYTDDLELRQTMTEDIPPGTYSLAVIGAGSGARSHQA
ncbi:MarR family winged helix-turn-helix transcriptional regulator [Marinobacter sp. ELB17]|uniref:MarR family winged helix-turn-helix transcriptional regulator n=1 Tax=Marinobacter sp. ELB17 TaxID=270374 RepID=UPI0000F37B49|nr:Tn5044 transposase [Marinobacter sp. ELB17]